MSRFTKLMLMLLLASVAAVGQVKAKQCRSDERQLRRDLAATVITSSEAEKGWNEMIACLLEDSKNASNYSSLLEPLRQATIKASFAHVAYDKLLLLRSFGAGEQ